MPIHDDAMLVSSGGSLIDSAVALIPALAMASPGHAEGGAVMADNESGIQWIFDPRDVQAHVLADAHHRRPDAKLVTMCGRELPASTPIFAVAPSLVACSICEPVSRIDRPPPTFPTCY